jgi:cytochrome c peroxidase
MRWSRVFRPTIVLMFSASMALAQGPPPPPPPPPPPAPLPPPLQPPGNPVTAAKANLGKALFWDEQMSSTRTVACGSCHQARAGGSDPRPGLAPAHAVNPGPDGALATADDIVGSPGVVLNTAGGAYAWSPVFGLTEQVTGRTTPSHINAAYSPLQFWDGRAAGAFVDPESGDTLIAAGGALEIQVLAPPVSTVEMGHLGRDWSDVAARLATSMPLALSPSVPADLLAWLAGRDYPQLFAEAFGSAVVTGARIAMAIASYERTLFSTQTPFDAEIAGTPSLTPQERAGFQLFGQLGCAGCHAGSLTSDNRFHYTGVRPAAEDSGRALVTRAPGDLGAMRTPSLRNVALRPAFMHGGQFTTLAEVVDFYDRGGDFDAPNKPPVIRPLNLTPQQKGALVAFMGRPLTDPRVAAGAAPFDQPALYRESALVPQVLAGGVAGSSGAAPQPVALEPPFAGNPSFTVGVFGARGGAEAVLVIDDAEPPAEVTVAPAGSFARLTTTLQGSGLADGFGSVTLAIAADPALHGRVLYGRWFVDDPGASGGVASSPAFRMQLFGPQGSGVAAVFPAGRSDGAVRLQAGQPNPFRESTVLRFELATPSRARLAVYDLGGRAVRRLFDRESAPAGPYALTWDGRDDAGRSVPGGIYFYRLETDRGAASARVVRLE